MTRNHPTSKLADKYFAEQCARLGPITFDNPTPPVTRKVTRKKKG